MSNSEIIHQQKNTVNKYRCFVRICVLFVSEFERLIIDDKCAQPAEMNAHVCCVYTIVYATQVYGVNGVDMFIRGRLI